MGWNNGENGTNRVGFSIRLGGFRQSDYGSFSDSTAYIAYWLYDYNLATGSGHVFSFYGRNDVINRSMFSFSAGNYVRCIMD